MRRQSLKKTRGLLSRENAMSRMPPTTTPKVRPTSELILVKSAKMSAKTPMASEGAKIFMPILLKLPSISSTVGAPPLPLSTCLMMGGMHMATRRAPAT